MSAFSGKVRPAYHRMLTDLADGTLDAVFVYNLDRLHRRPSELEDLVVLRETAGVTNVATVTADVDAGESARSLAV